MKIEKVLEIIRDEALLADNRAADACSRSKYSIQDYFMCIEFYLQNLHDRLARESGLPIRCPHFPMRVKIAALRKEVLHEMQAVEQSVQSDGATWESLGAGFVEVEPDHSEGE